MAQKLPVFEIVRWRVQRLLEADHLSQAELARTARIQPATLCRFLQRKCGLSLLQCERIAEAFGVSVPDLFRMTMDRKPPVPVVGGWRSAFRGVRAE